MKIEFSLSFNYKHRTVEEIKSLPDFSHQHAETSFKVSTKDGFLAVDNKNGMGATPDNANVLYKGCVVELTPDDFLSLALPTSPSDRIGDLTYLRGQIEAGVGIANPCLYVDIDSYVDKEPGLLRVTGHEGRARCLLMKELGVKTFPCQLLFNGYRSRHIGDLGEFAAWINTGVCPERKDAPIKVRLKML